jgi:hypothetical protein
MQPQHGRHVPAPSNGWIADLPLEHRIVFGVIALTIVGYFLYWLIKWAK